MITDLKKYPEHEKLEAKNSWHLAITHFLSFLEEAGHSVRHYSETRDKDGRVISFRYKEIKAEKLICEFFEIDEAQFHIESVQMQDDHMKMAMSARVQVTTTDTVGQRAAAATECQHPRTTLKRIDGSDVLICLSCARKWQVEPRRKRGRHQRLHGGDQPGGDDCELKITPATEHAP